MTAKNDEIRFCTKKIESLPNLMIQKGNELEEEVVENDSFWGK